MVEFVTYSKIPRASAVMCYITEKIDGTNAQICISAESGGKIQVGSRNRWIFATENVQQDNYGFARWVADNEETLRALGPGRHFGEWYGPGIGRNYGLDSRRFALFDRTYWNPEILAARGLSAIGVECVPMLATCSIEALDSTLTHVFEQLMSQGSVAVPGFAKPEGVVVSVGDGALRFKVTDGGNRAKWQVAAADRRAVQGGGLPESVL